MSGRDPFRVDGPALVSVSGGRTSAYMLWRILQAHGGSLPADVIACFANTGKEMLQTLDFVRDLAERWGVAIRWLEYRDRSATPCFVEVNHATASRNGEPFAAAMRHRSYLPNPVARFCTQELKIHTLHDFAQIQGWEAWTAVIGFRADEPRRVAKLAADHDDGEDRIAPLAAAGITKRDVAAFWRSQNFDLELPSVNGTTPLGNCDLCFLKSAATISGIMRDMPERAAWWIEQEAIVRSDKGAGQFRSDRPSYAAMMDAVRRQQSFDFGDIDQRVDCYCSEDAA